MGIAEREVYIKIPEEDQDPAGEVTGPPLHCEGPGDLQGNLQQYHLEMNTCQSYIAYLCIIKILIFSS